MTINTLAMQEAVKHYARVILKLRMGRTRAMAKMRALADMGEHL